MGAKDTVMTAEEKSKVMGEAIDKDITLIYPSRQERETVLLQAQAEISFKAGYEQALKDNGIDTTTSDVVK